MGKASESSKIVSSDDLTFILGGDDQKYTWDDFDKMMEQERAMGVPHCPRASYIALELLKPTLLAMPWRSLRTDSEAFQDMIQLAYLRITEQIETFDKSKSSFKTYITKWFQGLAREMRDDGISDYQRKKFGFKLYSTDAMVANVEGEGEIPIEFEDEKASIEYELEKKSNARTNQLLHQTIGNNIELEGANGEDKQKIYQTAACYHKMFGGIRNLSEQMRDTIEDIVMERKQLV